MSQGFVSKIFKTLVKIAGYIKIKKKSDTMPEDNQQPVQPVQPTTVLGANTQIVMTPKQLIGLLSGVLGLFVSFYFMVFVPRADKVEEYQKELMDKQQVEISKQFDAVNDGIELNNKNIVDLGLRFKDLNDAVDDIGNTSGGFGGNRTTAATEPAVDTSLIAHN